MKTTEAKTRGAEKQESSTVAPALASSSGERFPPPLVEETLQYRLDTGNIGKTGGQRGSLTRCAQKYGAFQHQIMHGKDAEEIETSKQDLVNELGLFRLEMTKLWFYAQRLQRQVQENEKAIEAREEEIQQQKSVVEQSEQDAARALETRNCLLEYEALAAFANSKFSQPRCKLEQQIAAVQQEYQQLQRQQDQVNKTLKVRESQFHLLLQYMTDLKRSIHEDEENTSHHAGNENHSQQRQPQYSTLSSPPKRVKLLSRDDDEEGAIEEDGAEGEEAEVDDPMELEALASKQQRGTTAY